MAAEWQILRDWVLGAEADSVATATGNSSYATGWTSLHTYPFEQSVEFNRALKRARNCSLLGKVAGTGASCWDQGVLIRGAANEVDGVAFEMVGLNICQLAYCRKPHAEVEMSHRGSSQMTLVPLPPVLLNSFSGLDRAVMDALRSDPNPLHRFGVKHVLVLTGHKYDIVAGTNRILLPNGSVYSALCPRATTTRAVCRDTRLCDLAAKVLENTELYTDEDDLPTDVLKLVQLSADYIRFLVRNLELFTEKGQRMRANLCYELVELSLALGPLVEEAEHYADAEDILKDCVGLVSSAVADNILTLQDRSNIMGRFRAPLENLATSLANLMRVVITIPFIKKECDKHRLILAIIDVALMFLDSESDEVQHSGSFQELSLIKAQDCSAGFLAALSAMAKMLHSWSNIHTTPSVRPETETQIEHQMVSVDSLSKGTRYSDHANCQIRPYSESYEYLDRGGPKSFTVQTPTRQEVILKVSHGQIYSYVGGIKKFLKAVVPTEVAINVKFLTAKWSIPSQQKYPDAERDLLNQLLGGAFGADAGVWALGMIHDGKLRIHANSAAKCYVPNSALAEEGYNLYTPLSRIVASKLVYIAKKSRTVTDVGLWWLPHRQGNVFRIDYDLGTGLHHACEEERVDQDLGSFELVTCGLNSDVGA